MALNQEHIPWKPAAGRYDDNLPYAALGDIALTPISNADGSTKPGLGIINCNGVPHLDVTLPGDSSYLRATDLRQQWTNYKCFGAIRVAAGNNFRPIGTQETLTPGTGMLAIAGYVRMASESKGSPDNIIPNNTMVAWQSCAHKDSRNSLRQRVIPRCNDFSGVELLPLWNAELVDLAHKYGAVVGKVVNHGRDAKNGVYYVVRME